MRAIKTDHFYIRADQRGITKKEIRCIERVGIWDLQDDRSWKIYWQDILVIATSDNIWQTIYRTGEIYEPKVVVENTNIYSLDMFRNLLGIKKGTLKIHNPDEEFEMDYDAYMSSGKKTA